MHNLHQDQLPKLPSLMEKGILPCHRIRGRVCDKKGRSSCKGGPGGPPRPRQSWMVPPLFLLLAPRLTVPLGLMGGQVQRPEKQATSVFVYGAEMFLGLWVGSDRGRATSALGYSGTHLCVLLPHFPLTPSDHF